MQLPRALLSRDVEHGKIPSLIRRSISCAAGSVFACSIVSSFSIVPSPALELDSAQANKIVSLGPISVGPFLFKEVLVSQVPIVCPKCGSNKFRVSKQVKTLDDMIGAPCDSCGTPLTEEEVKQQGCKIATDIAKKAFGKLDKTRVNLKL
jgi:hypothetical protein